MEIGLPKAINFSDIQARLASQFSDLDPKDPSVWPVFPRVCLLLAAAAGVVVLLWFGWIGGSQEELQREQEKEIQLREEYKTKLVKAVNLDVLKKQREQVQQHVSQIEKQLPSKAEMDALLSDINQAGIGRSLQFELFRPSDLVVKEYYAELPIAIKVSGRYHDIGAFASDIAHLSRIVTLTDIGITQRREGVLVLEAWARTFRYLAPEEVAAQKSDKKGRN